MKLKEFKKLAPASVPVASIPFRGGILDLFPMRGKDIFWLMHQAPALVKAWSDQNAQTDEEDQDETEEAPSLLAAIGQAGPVVINRIIAAATRADEQDLEELDLVADEQIDIVLTALDAGMPEDLLGKLVVGARTAMVRAGMSLPTLASAGFLSGSGAQGLTPTASPSPRPSSSAKPSKSSKLKTSSGKSGPRAQRT
ncbi:hypothetical protein [Paracoccus sp. SSK6]|uniref:hypothetical protein n=1 Tax=Paracoccus sp. SSK6 TaxID=3143131 RepID=UPI00321B058B